MTADRATTEGTLLGGRVRFDQPARGYRAAIDPVLLAAAAPAPAAGRAIDLGCGAGAALLCLAWRTPDLSLVGVERDPALAALARDNLSRNGWDERARIVTGDAGDPPGVAAGEFDLAIANPPYLPDTAADASPDAAKAAATVEADLELGGWVAAALRLVRPRGAVVFVHRADRLDALLAALAGRAGAIEVIPLWPKSGAPAKRIVVRARKGVRTPLVLSPGLVLHEADGKFTEAAERILRDGRSLDEAISSTGRGPGGSSGG